MAGVLKIETQIIVASVIPAKAGIHSSTSDSYSSYIPKRDGVMASVSPYRQIYSKSAERELGTAMGRW